MKPLEITPLARLRIVKAAIVSTVDTTAPGAPQNLVASNVTSSTVDLDWDSVVAGDLSYYSVYRSLEGAAFVKITTDGQLTTNSTVVSSLAQDANYDFYVTATDQSGNESAPSNTVSVSTADVVAPSQLTGLVLSNVTDTTIDLAWDESGASDLDYYSVYRSDAGAAFAKITTDGALNTNSYADSGLSNGVLYAYYVTATDVSGNESVPSDQKSATTSTLTAFYVSSSGNDTNSGALSSPWQTISRANSQSYNPGDQLLFNRGDTFEGLLTVDESGTVNDLITIGAYGSGADPILRAVSLEGNYITVNDIDFDNDGQSPGLQDRVVHVRGDNITINNGKVHNATVDGIDIRGGATNFTIDGTEIYHLLAGSYGSEDDAHGIGIRAGAGNSIVGTISNTNIHEVSGDSIQTDPDRSVGGTVNLTGSGNTWWTQPLASSLFSWNAGESPGENAIDTKMRTDGLIVLNFTDTTMYGWEDQVGGISNRAALNLKETVTATFNRLTVYDCEIAFRCRGDTGNGSPNIKIQNAVVYDCLTAIRAEDSINNLKLYNNTFGDGITTFLQEVAGGISTGEDLRNNAFLGTKPAAFSDPTNASASSADFVDSAADDYRLLEGSSLIDAGATIAGVTVDRAGNTRSGAYEIGAYDGFVASSSHAYFELLAAQPEMVLTKAFSSATLYSGTPQQEIDATYLVPTSGAYKAGLWTYDAVQDAAKLDWEIENHDGSLSAGSQLRWGNTGGYNEVEPTSFGTLGTSTFLMVWEWRFDSSWAKDARDLTIPDVLNNHKAFQAARDGQDLTIEPRFRYGGGAAQFPSASGNQVCHVDLRSYIGADDGPGNGVLQTATIYPEPDEWFRLFLFLDGGNLEVSYWAHVEGQSLIQMIDRAGGFNSTMRDIDNFWFELNSSQEGGSGITGESLMWGRNWVCLDGLTYAEAVALVNQSSW